MIDTNAKQPNTFLAWIDDLGRYAEKPPVSVICTLENTYDVPFDENGVCAGCIADAKYDDRE